MKYIFSCQQVEATWHTNQYAAIYFVDDDDDDDDNDDDDDDDNIAAAADDDDDTANRETMASEYAWRNTNKMVVRSSVRIWLIPVWVDYYVTRIWRKILLI